MALPADTPGYLSEAPTGGVPELNSMRGRLPYDLLPWPDFEKLVLRLAETQGDVEHCQQFGLPGQAQDGIDVYTRTVTGAYVAYQCKRYEELKASDLVEAVDRWLGGRWSNAAEFVFATSADTRERKFALAIEEQTERLKKFDPPRRLTIWGPDALDRELRSYDDMVVDFFSERWLELFSPSAAQAREQLTLHDIKEAVLQNSAPPMVATLGWARDRLRETVDRYRADRPEQLAKFIEHVGEDFDAARVAGFITVSPAWTGTWTGEDWRVTGEVAEARGLWPEAGTAYLTAAELTAEPYDRAGLLAGAGAALGVAGDRDRRAELVEQAREMCPTHPKALVLGLAEDSTPSEHLDILQKAEARGEQDTGLLVGQRLLAHLRLGDLKAAREAHKEVERLLPDTLLARSLAVCITVQEGRMRVADAATLDTATIRAAGDEALRVREQYLAERRWDEAARMLMLAADANTVIWRHARAGQLLQSATTEERSSEAAAEVLGHAALRVMRFDLALDFCRDAGDRDSVRLIRASALREIGTPHEREQALADLDQLLELEGFDGFTAAYLRLATTIDSDAAWSDRAEQRLKDAGYERQALVAKAYRATWRGGSGIQAATGILRDHLDKGWTATILFRCAQLQKRDSVLRDAARRALDAGPSQVVRVDAGQALAKTGDFEEAYRVLIGPADDPSCPVRSRHDAYAALVAITGREWNQWDRAGELYDAWLELEGHDRRLPQWGPLVYARRSRS